MADDDGSSASDSEDRSCIESVDEAEDDNDKEDSKESSSESDLGSDSDSTSEIESDSDDDSDGEKPNDGISNYERWVNWREQMIRFRKITTFVSWGSE